MNIELTGSHFSDFAADQSSGLVDGNNTVNADNRLGNSDRSDANKAYSGLTKLVSGDSGLTELVSGDSGLRHGKGATVNSESGLGIDSIALREGLHSDRLEGWLGGNNGHRSDGLDLLGNRVLNGLLNSQLLDLGSDREQILSDDGLSHVLGALTLSVGDNGVDVLNDRVDLLGDLSVGLNDFSDLLHDRLDHLVLDSRGFVLRLGLLDFSDFARNVLLRNSHSGGARSEMDVDGLVRGLYHDFLGNDGLV